MLAAQPGPVSGVVLTFTVLVTSIALVAGLAWASARLLGLPVGTVRAVIAGLLGFAAAVGITQILQPVQTAGRVAAFIIAALGVPLIVAMLFIVVAEALVPTGTGPQPVQVIRGARRAFARSRRYSQISQIAVRHGLGPYLRGRQQLNADA
jgi:ubiquinone biosynthesis protein